MEKIVEQKSTMMFSYVAGLIPREDQLRFERLLFRRTRGNVLTVMHPSELPPEICEKKEGDKTLFIVIFRESEKMRTGVTKVCEAFTSEM